jgi:hypothetical protein
VGSGVGGGVGDGVGGAGVGNGVGLPVGGVGAGVYIVSINGTIVIHTNGAHIAHTKRIPAMKLDIVIIQVHRLHSKHSCPLSADTTLHKSDSHERQ